MPCRVTWIVMLALSVAFSGLLGCASQQTAQQRVRLSGAPPRPSRGVLLPEALIGLQSALRSSLTSTDALISEDSGLVRVSVVAGAIFSVDGVELSPGADEILQTLATTLAEYPATGIEVRAFTDDLDSASSALGLTQKRADMVALYLTRHGIAPERIRACGEGQSAAVESNSDPEGRRANRRVEILISTLSS